MTTIAETIEALKARNAFGIASAVKRGRNPEFPYVPVVKATDENGQPATGLHQTSNPCRGLAYASRDEAVARAQRSLDAQYADVAMKLAKPNYRALREWYGLPRELADVQA